VVGSEGLRGVARAGVGEWRWKKVYIERAGAEEV